MQYEQIRKEFEDIRQTLRAMIQESQQRAQEAEQRFQKIDAEFESIQQIIKQNAEEAKQRSRETDQKIQKFADIFTNHWGRLVEALLEPESVKLFQDRGINVTKSKKHHGRSRNGKHIEIDLLLKNKNEKVAVVIEVKTTPNPDDVHKFLDKFDTLLDFFPKYKGYTIYGAIAGIQIDESVTKFAYRRGLFVFTLGNEGLVRMLNDKKFTPTIF